MAQDSLTRLARLKVAKAAGVIPVEGGFRSMGGKKLTAARNRQLDDSVKRMLARLQAREAEKAKATAKQSQSSGVNIQAERRKVQKNRM